MAWKWYNKVDTKLREFNERWYFMKRKSYDKQFKMAAVKLILEEEVPVSVVAKELEIHQNTLYRWVNEYEEMENMTPKFNTPKKPTKWKWYNKVDTKLREFNERLTIKSQDKFKKNKTVKILHNKKTEISV